MAVCELTFGSGLFVRNLLMRFWHLVVMVQVKATVCYLFSIFLNESFCIFWWRRLNSESQRNLTVVMNEMLY